MSTYKQDNMTIHNADCMEIMAGYEDDYFDLAVVDCPYGIGEGNRKRENTKSSKWKAPTDKVHNLKDWDSETPDQEYFDELFRVSKNQIIWGANYMIDKIKKPSMGWIFWDKKNGDSDFSDGELAYTSFKKGLRKFEWLWNGFQKQKPEKRIHACQKPIALYNWIYANYAEEGQKILDTHLGSGSNAIAAHYAKMHFVGCELDEDYYKASIERIKKETRQLELF